MIANRGAAIGEVTHFTGVARCHPLVVPGALRGRLGGRDTGQFEAAFARQLADGGGGQISNPTLRISSMALLFRTTPDRRA